MTINIILENESLMPPTAKLGSTLFQDIVNNTVNIIWLMFIQYKFWIFKHRTIVENEL